MALQSSYLDIYLWRENPGRNMEKPNWKELKKFHELLLELDRVFSAVLTDESRQEQEVRGAFAMSLKANAGRSLAQIPVDELKKSRAGIRTAALKDAGFVTLSDLANASDAQICIVDGVGEKQVSSIRNIIAEFMNNILDYTSVRIDPDDDSGENNNLICAVSRYRMGQKIRASAEPVCQDLHSFVADIGNALVIKNGFHWVFSGRKAKESTVWAYNEMKSFFLSDRYAEIKELTKMYQRASEIGIIDARVDFSHNAAEFYAILEKLNGRKISKSLIYSSIPEQLAAEIDDVRLELGSFRGNLRAYQEFGTKYILHQGRVLLGDEMGLGKTIQAIAAMVHISAGSPDGRFLVVCPAGVLVNWCREIKKFSALSVHLLHGPFLEDSFESWRQSAGCAVTNYESMGKIIDRIDEQMHLDMLIVDEAHYIKNPDAKRTEYIRRLENESTRILLMTGTPVENRVSEMCALIDFIRPDMAKEVREKAYMSAAPEFREMLAPVYLRRQRDMVLDELPPIEEIQEWCSLEPADLAAYAASVAEKNFTAMRRVGFHLEDASVTCKGKRIAELCEEAKAEGRKVIVYSFFRETISKVSDLLKEECAGVITGSTDTIERQKIIDRFSGQETKAGSVSMAGSSERANGTDGRNVLICQIQAGGTGLNIQAASIVIFCEPQIKPSLTSQAIARVYRMGQVRNVLVYHLLCENTVDEAMIRLLEEKQKEFDLYADESAMADATEGLFDREWIRQYIEEENRKYLPAVADPLKITSKEDKS